MNTVIIGGGASGIAAALRIKMNNPDIGVTVLEHLDEACKKLYATGNGRCNITNINAEGFDKVSEFLRSLGLVLRESGEGRIYPYSNQASTVVKTLISSCKKYGVKIVTSCTVKKAEELEGRFYIYTDKGIFTAVCIIIATGGKAQKALGSDGSGYALAEGFGHRKSDLSPALVQLKSSSKNCRSLKGVRTKCTVKIEVNKEILGEDFGELLFTEYGISGIVTMNLSHFVNDRRLESGEDRCSAIIDFVPDMSEEELLSHAKKYGSFEGILPSKLCSIIARQSDDNFEKGAKYIKNWRLIITGTKGFDFAQITSGGIVLKELKNTFESVLCDGLYIVGELCDRQFCCGGYNLNFAFLSGITAADDILNYDKN